jgi:hypothetical protein
MPGAEPDPREVLGVSASATRAQIRTAYLELVARYHPDKHRGNPLEPLAAEKLRQINRAYEQLSGPSDPRDRPVPRSVARDRPVPYSIGSGLLRTVGWLVVLGLALRFGPRLRGSPLLVVALLVIVALAVRWAVRRGRQRP